MGGRVFCVCLTGGLASGKSAVAAMLAAKGATVADADDLARELCAPGGAALPALRRALGARAFLPDGGLNRAALRAQIFAAPALRARVEAILHPQIRALMRRRLAAATGRYAVGVVPLLFEAAKAQGEGAGAESWRGLFDCVVAVCCRPQTQLARAKRRDAAADAAAIMALQCGNAERKKKADIVLRNDGSLPQLRAAVENLHKKFIIAECPPKLAQ